MSFPPPIPQTSGPHLWRRLTHDWAAKLLSLVAAFLLWFYASADRRAIVQQTFDVPVTVRDNTGAAAGEERAVSGLTPSTVKVTLEGRPQRLNELRGDRIEAVADVTNLPEGSFNVAVTVTAPENTAAVRLSPDRVQGLIDAVQTRTLLITVLSPAPDGTAMPRYRLRPAEVRVSGPSRAVNRVQQVIYAPVPLHPTESESVSLLALGEGGQPVPDITLAPASVILTRVDSGQPVPLQPAATSGPSTFGAAAAGQAATAGAPSAP